MTTDPENKTKAEKAEELRRHRRFSVNKGSLEVSWLDAAGKMKNSQAKVVNVSENGIALQVPKQVMPLLMRFQSERFAVKGVGAVRHCSRAGSKFVVGLEFGVDLHWKAPEGEVVEPIPLCDPKPKRGLFS